MSSRMSSRRSNPKAFYQRGGKRLLDIFLAGTLLLALAPLLAVVALAVRLAMGSPVLFRQSRPGWHGELFTCYKFRTMRPSPGARVDGALDGQRLTSLGTFLRRASLDELPELWNVLRGDMSLVGPRPLLPRYLQRYSPREARRHEVRPGMTGWAQIRGRNALSWEDKFAHDLWYVEHLTLTLDLRILAATLWRVLSGQGIRAAGYATMPEFMGHDGGAQEGKHDGP